MNLHFTQIMTGILPAEMKLTMSPVIIIITNFLSQQFSRKFEMPASELK
jgi:hypothetical protein